jgi:hypothetical protein
MRARRIDDKVMGVTDTYSQADIKQALSYRYGAESKLPSWTAPFIHAVELLESLGNRVKPPGPPEEPVYVMSSRSRTVLELARPSAAKKEVERMMEEAVTSLQSVSTAVIFAFTG